MFGDHGFTLLETIVAVTIVSLVGIGVMGAFAADERGTMSAARQVEAAALAQHRMAFLTLATRDDLDPLPDSLRRGDFDTPFKDYHWEAVSKPVRGRSDLYAAEVRITWPEGGLYVIRTVFYRPPTNDGTL